MKQYSYSDEEKDEFVAVAQEKGIGPAMRELGYPGSHHTANKWFDERGLEKPTVSALQRHAANLGVYYKDKEEIAVVQLLMDRYTDMLIENNMTPDELNKLANGYQKVMQTKRLLEGKSVNVNQSIDGTDLEILKLTKEMEERNEQFEAGENTDSNKEEIESN